MRPHSFASLARTARTKRKRRRNEADLPVTGGRINRTSSPKPPIFIYPHINVTNSRTHPNSCRGGGHGQGCTDVRLYLHIHIYIYTTTGESDNRGNWFQLKSVDQTVKYGSKSPFHEKHSTIPWLVRSSCLQHFF